MSDADLTEAGESELANALRGGNLDALAETYRRWSASVFTLALRALNNREDAEDVTQQVFVSAWNSRGTLRHLDPNVQAWLIGIAKHRIADARRSRWRSVRNVEAVAASSEDVGMSDDLATRMMLADELGRLGEPRSTVMRMSLVDDRPHGEIAQTLGLPLGTVKSHLRRGLLQLRTRLREVEHAL